MVQGIEQKLLDKKVQPTAMRMLVLDYLSKQSSAVGLTDIEKSLSPADRTTIYRSLKTFEEHGLVHSIEDGTGTPKYALCIDNCETGAHHDLHVHFYCNVCKETFCLPKSAIPGIALPAGFKTEELNLTAKGVCERCNK